MAKLVVQALHELMQRALCTSKRQGCMQRCANPQEICSASMSCVSELGRLQFSAGLHSGWMLFCSPQCHTLSLKERLVASCWAYGMPIPAAAATCIRAFVTISLIASKQVQTKNALHGVAMQPPCALHCPPTRICGEQHSFTCSMNLGSRPLFSGS